MASIEIDGYCIDYSIVDGTISGFSKKSDGTKWEPVTENREETLLALAKRIMELESPGRSYSAFIYKLAKEGKLEIPQANTV